MISWLMQSHRVGGVLGFEVRIAYSLYLFVGLLSFLSLLTLSSGWQLFGVLGYFLLPLFVLAHELGHSLAAMKEGVGVRAILLTPIGGLAQLDGMLPGPGAEIVVALAGPFVSFFLAGLFALPSLLMGDFSFGAGPVGMILSFGVMANLMLGLFNLLPIFPLDGGRVAAAGAVLKWGPQKGLHAVSGIARIGLLILVGLGVFRLFAGDTLGAVMMIVIAYFLHTRGQQELQARQYAERYLGGVSHGAEPWRNGSTVWTAPSDENPWEDPDAVLKPKKPGWWARLWLNINVYRESRHAAQEKAEREEVDRILSKVKAEGIQSLTPQERDTLNRASQHAREKQPPR